MLRVDEIVPYKDGFHRRGIIADGSCFFHAILYALSNEYRTFSIEQRQRAVVHIREKASELCFPDRILSLGKGMACLPMFHALCLQAFPETEKMLEKYANKPVRELIQHMEGSGITELIDTCVRLYREMIRNPNAWVSYELFELLQDILDVNVVILQESGPYIFGDDVYIPNRPYVILYWNNQVHFELIGKDDVYVFTKETLHFNIC
jgi:hypothetical protein